MSLIQYIYIYSYTYTSHSHISVSFLQTLAPAFQSLQKFRKKRPSAGSKYEWQYKIVLPACFGYRGLAGWQQVGIARLVHITPTTWVTLDISMLSRGVIKCYKSTYNSGHHVMNLRFYVLQSSTLEHLGVLPKMGR